MKSAVFEGVRLMAGSDAFEMYHDHKDKNHVKLRAHMAELDRVWKKMEGRS